MTVDTTVPRALRTATLLMTQEQLASTGLAVSRLVHHLSTGGKLEHDLDFNRLISVLMEVCELVGQAVENTMTPEESAEVQELAAEMRAKAGR